jgi:orotate phosphoribosyltransferase
VPTAVPRPDIVALLEKESLLRLAEPIQLTSGAWSSDYLDVKKAVLAGRNLRLVCEAVCELVASEGVEFDAVGGLTMGADAFAHGIALVADKEWFVVRKAAKEHGTRKRIEGNVGPDVRVLLVDDVITTGGSILEALAAVREVDADVVLAVTIVDRGEQAGPKFRAAGVPYRPLVTYADLGIDPVEAPDS